MPASASDGWPGHEERYRPARRGDRLGDGADDRNGSSSWSDDEPTDGWQVPARQAGWSTSQQEEDWRGPAYDEPYGGAAPQYQEPGDWRAPHNDEPYDQLAPQYQEPGDWRAPHYDQPYDEPYGRPAPHYEEPYDEPYGRPAPQYQEPGDWRAPGRDVRPEAGDGRAADGYGDRAGPAESGRAPSRRSRRRRRRSPRARLILRIAGAVVGLFALVTAWSFGSAILNPGMGPTIAARAAEWARDHYLGPIVTFGEWISYQPPKVGGKPGFSLATGLGRNGRRPAKARRHHAISAAPPARLKAVAGKPLPGEGVWRVLASVHGIPAIWGTYLRPSRIYTSYVSGVVSMNQQLVRFQLRPGAEDPGPGNWHARPFVAPGTRRGLVATFNGGFKISSAGGGFYLNGASDGTLQPGAASEVYYRDGRLAIGSWDQNVRMTPQVVGVRQNLKLIVVDGKIPASVDYNVESSWGATLGGSYYVWRSGIGITKTGRIIFAYGPALNVRMLASLLQKAGAVSGMQLDINPEWMSYMYYTPGNHPANPIPHNLLPDQNQAPGRYYSVSSRDFTAVYAR